MLCSNRTAELSHFPGTDVSTWKVLMIQRRNSLTPKRSCRPFQRTTQSMSPKLKQSRTPRNRQLATRTPRSSKKWKNLGSAVPQPTPPSSQRSRTEATCGRKGQRWSLASPPLPSSNFSKSTSQNSSTTTSPRRWRTVSTPLLRGPKSHFLG